MPMYEAMENCKFCNKDIDYYFSDYNRKSEYTKGDTYDFCAFIDVDNSSLDISYQNPVSDGNIEIPIRYCPICSKDLHQKRKYQNGVYNYITSGDFKKYHYKTDRFAYVIQCRIETWSEKSNRYGILINTKERNELGYLGVMKWVDEDKIIDDDELEKLEEDGVAVYYD